MERMEQEGLVFSYAALLRLMEREELGLTEEFTAVRKSFLKEKPVKAQVLYLDEADAAKGKVYLEENRLTVCDELIRGEIFLRYQKNELCAGMLFLLTTSGTYQEEMEISELSYHIVQNKCLDLARNLIKHNFITLLKKEPDKDIWSTQCLGPGYFGMELNEGKKIHRLLEGEKLGVSYIGDLMKPVKSTSGILLGMRGDREALPGACVFCKASKENCLFCGGL